MSKELEKIKLLESRVKALENELEELASYYDLAKAVCEIQNELKNLHPNLNLFNQIYAPMRVGV